MGKAACGRDIAKRAWFTGWTKQYVWARPLKDVLIEEQESARAEQRRQEEISRDGTAEEREKARQDAVSSLAQEGQLVKVGRGSVLSALASASKLLPALNRVAEQVRDSLNVDKIDPRRGMEVLRSYSALVNSLVQSAQRLIECERQVKGEPTRIIGIEPTAPMTLEQALGEAADVTTLFALAQSQGLVDDPDKLH